MTIPDYITDVSCLKEAKGSIRGIINRIDFDPQSFSIKDFIAFRKELGELGQAFTKAINLAVLGGEFYSYEAKIIIDDILINSIPLLTKKIDEFTTAKIIPDKSLSKFFADRSASIGDNFLEKFIREYIKSYHKIQGYIQKYSDLLDFIQTSILRKDKISIKSFLAESIDKMDTYKLISELELEVASSDNSQSFQYIVRNRFAIFQLNVLLFKVDNTLISSSVVLERLLEIRQLLNREIFTGFDLTRILIDKSNYLLKKTVLRQLENEKFVDDYSEDHTKVSDLNIIFYKFFDEKTSLHYHEAITGVPTDTEIAYEKAIATPSALFEHFHYLNKRYRKGNRSGKMELFKRQFENYKKKKSLLNRFEEIAIQTTTNLINNTEFMLLCKESVNKIEGADEQKINGIVIQEVEKVNKQYTNCISSQERMDRFNYRSPLEFFKYITNVLENISTKTISFSTLNRVMELALKCRTDLKKNLRWEQKKNDLPLYFPFDESICFYDLRDQKHIATKSPELLNQGRYLKLFLDSTYVLPVNYLDVENEVLEIELKYEHHKNMLVDRTVEGNLERSKKELESEVKQSTKQYISLLAMFATILSFVLGTLKIVLELRSKESIVVFMVGLAASLMTFTIMIEFTIVRNSKERTWYHVCILLLSLLFVAYCFWLMDPPAISIFGSSLDK